MRSRDENDEEETEQEPLSLDNDDPRRNGRMAYRVLKWVCAGFAAVSWLGAGMAMLDVPKLKDANVLQENVLLMARLYAHSYFLPGCMFMLGALFCQREEHRRDL
jgi:hypothetical protein